MTLNYWAAESHKRASAIGIGYPAALSITAPYPAPCVAAAPAVPAVTLGVLHAKTQYTENALLTTAIYCVIVPL